MNRILAFLSVFLFVLSSTGCTFFAHPRDKPIIKDEMRAGDKAIATIAVDASRRVVAIDVANGQICAEPPPDIAESVARSFSAALTAAVERDDLKADLAAALASEYERVVKQLSPLSQGVKFARDSLFALCQLNRNNTDLGANDLYYLYVAVVNEAAILISQEIPYLKQGFDPSEASLQDAAKALELLKEMQGELNAESEADAKKDSEVGGRTTEEQSGNNEALVPEELPVEESG